MSLSILCAKGCGETITVSDEMIDEARKHNAPLNVSHEVCPNSPEAPQRHFKLQIIIKEMFQTGDTCLVCKQKVDGEGGTLRHIDTPEDWLDDHEPKRSWAETGQEEDTLFSAGEDMSAGSFVSALPELQVSVERQWGYMKSMADVIDQPREDPQSDQAEQTP